jgi:hypothetical protein
MTKANRNGTNIGVAALIPANITTKHAITNKNLVAKFISNLAI